MSFLAAALTATSTSSSRATRAPCAQYRLDVMRLARTSWDKPQCQKPALGAISTKLSKIDRSVDPARGVLTFLHDVLMRLLQYVAGAGPCAVGEPPTLVGDSLLPGHGR